VAPHSALGAVYAMRFIHRTDPDDLVRAAGYLERALELNPELAEPPSYLFYVYLRQNRIDQAIEAGLRTVAWQPDVAQAHYFLGVAYWFGTGSDPGHCQHIQRVEKCRRAHDQARLDVPGRHRDVFDARQQQRNALLIRGWCQSSRPVDRGRSSGRPLHVLLEVRG
jgi:hypothetical protein